MNNEYYNNSEVRNDYVILNGIPHELINGLYYPVDDSPSDEAYEQEDIESAYTPRKSIDESKNNRRPSLTKPTKILLGSMAVGMFVIPTAVHFGTEQVTNYFVDLASPAEDKAITQDELISDLGKTFEELGPKNIGRIIEGMR